MVGVGCGGFEVGVGFDAVREEAGVAVGDVEVVELFVTGVPEDA
jgi:hypothetical protein